jgi:uncharacterized integral membrane protein
MTASACLTLAGFAAFAVTFIVARFSRWRWHSPLVAICLEAVAALMTASGATSGNWPLAGVGALFAVLAGKIAVTSARARRAITAHGGKTGAGHG